MINEVKRNEGILHENLWNGLFPMCDYIAMLTAQAFHRRKLRPLHLSIADPMHLPPYWSRQQLSRQGPRVTHVLESTNRDIIITDQNKLPMNMFGIQLGVVERICIGCETVLRVRCSNPIGVGNSRYLGSLWRK